MGHPVSLVSAVSAVGFAAALWLGAYLWTAGRNQGTVRWAASAFFSLALYFLHAVLCLHVPAEHAGFLWRRFLGWFVVPFFALWLHTTAEASGHSRHRPGRLLVLLLHAAAAALAGFWLWGRWTFSSAALHPVELRLPVAVFALTSGAAASLLWLFARNDVVRAGMALVSALFGLGGAILSVPRLPDLSPQVPILVGESLWTGGVVWCGVAVGRTGLFLEGKAVARDLCLHLATAASVVLAYGAVIVFITDFARRLRFDPLTLAAVAVLGLVILTHLLVDDLRSLWDRLFFPTLAPLRSHLRSLTSELSRDDRVAALEKILGSARSVLRARWVRLDLPDGLALGLPRSMGETEEHPPEEAVLRHPVYVGDQAAGELLVGGREDRQPYGQEELQWLMYFAGQISLFLSHEATAQEEVGQLDETLRRLRAIREEQLRLRSEVRETILCADLLRPEEVRRILRMGASPDRLGEIACSTQDRLHFLHSLGPERAGHLLRRALEASVEEIRPAEEGPSLAELRDRPMRRKRKARLPVLWAEYYIAKLLLAGYTIEAIAEELELSPRQVHHHLDRLAVRLAPLLEAHLRGIST
jgi:hypothetical protein